MRDPANFAKMLSAWETMCQSDEVVSSIKKRQNRGLASALVILAAIEAQVKPDEEFKFWKAMRSLLDKGEAKTFTADDESRDLIAGLLVLATEVMSDKKK